LNEPARSAQSRRAAAGAGEKAPAHEDEMPADGTLAARLPGEEFGTSRFQGSYRSRYRMYP
jgi:hypothetical protein